jgi:hypothetical protein
MSRRVATRESAETIAVASVMPADGPSFGIAPSGMCTCTSVRRLKSRGMPKSSDARPQPAHRRLRGFLHDVAQLAGERQASPAGHEAFASVTRISPRLPSRRGPSRSRFSFLLFSD